jgi:DNA-binding response OmpR family regulator
MSRGPILVVDDDGAIRHTVAEILMMEEYAVATAPNGAEALLAVEQERPGLVLLDMRMPILDGWGFVRGLKERNITLPILVMTAAQDSANWAAEVGAAGYLAKPFDLPELLNAVERLYGPG